MREIIREEHEFWLNLFIMNLMFDTENLGPIVGFEYGIIKESRQFKLIKDCFPMDEYHLPLMFSLLLGGNVNGNIVVNLNEV